MNDISIPSLSELDIDPIERSQTLPSAWYTEKRFHDLDLSVVLQNSWQYAGHSLMVERPGQFLTATIAGNPVIIVRGKDEQLRAFYNVCRHRGGPLALDEFGSCNALQCKYHGWTYLLDGSLRGVPKFDRVDLFDKKNYGLVPIPMEVWEGLIFVNLQRSVQQESISTLTEGIAGRIAPISLATKLFAKRVVYEARCNWKVYVDNYLEGYHLPYVHPELCTLLDFQHYVTETSRYHSLQHSPFTGADNIYGDSDGEAFYYFLFPNMMLNILPGRLQTNTVVPLAPDRTSIIFDYYYDEVTSPEAVRKMEDDFAYSDKVQAEDIEICERVQRGLESLAYDKGRFSVEMEQGVYHFQSLLKETYRKALYGRTAG